MGGDKAGEGSRHAVPRRRSGDGRGLATTGDAAVSEDGSRWRLLLIDDERSHRERLARELEGFGHEAATASTSAGALAKLRAKRPDWVCVEPFLPESSWFRCLHSLAEFTALGRWLVITAFPSSSLAAEAMELGAREVLTKPVTGAELLAACRGAASQRTPVDAIDLSLAHLEWEHLNKVLRLCDGNVSEASRYLGIPRQSLYNKLRKMPRIP
jgi:two-component system response regulator RegA